MYIIFTSIEVSRLDDFSYYKEIQSKLDAYVSANIIINIIYFFVFSIIWVALLGFGSLILLISGILFGQLLGTLVSVISISIGALILYTIGNFFFSEFVKKILQKKFDRYIELFQKMSFIIFLSIDLSAV